MNNNIVRQIVSNPVARGIKVLGDRWTILVLRDAFLGFSRFEQFRARSGVSRSTLSGRLNALVENGIFEKRAYQQSPLRQEYKLTDLGRKLYPWALMVWRWEYDWKNSDVAGVPEQLLHRTDSPHPLVPVCICRHCQGEMHFDDVERVVKPGADLSHRALASFGQLRRSRGSGDSGSDARLNHIAELIGDRWSTLVLASAFIGLQRYDDMVDTLGIATNVLSDRLKKMTEMGVFERREYQSRPPRSEYCLTEKGKSLYPQIMALRQWVLDNMPPVEHSFELIHRPCGKPLQVDVVCGECNQVPEPSSVGYSLERYSAVT